MTNNPEQARKLAEALLWYATQLPHADYRHHAQRALGIYEILDPTRPPEAPWVAEMRQHHVEHGFYRASDLERLLGAPGDSAAVDENGNIVLRRSELTRKDTA